MTAEAGARSFFAKYGPSLYQMVDPANELTLSRTGTLENGTTYVTFTQQEGVPVRGGRLSVLFDAKGRIALISGPFVPGLSGMNVHPGLDPAAALTAADQDAHATHSGLGSSLTAPAPALVIDPLIAATPTLVYDLIVAYAAPQTTYPNVDLHYRVDANTGQILLSEPGGYGIAGVSGGCSATSCVPVNGTGQGVLGYQGIVGDTKTFPAIAVSDGGPYLMLYQGNPGSQRAAVDNTATIIVSEDQNSWDTDPPDPGAAVDAYRYAGLADDWWAARRANIGALTGDAVVVVPHFPSPAANDGEWDIFTHWIFIGGTVPAGTGRSIAAGLDVLAHEYTHGIVTAIETGGFQFPLDSPDQNGQNGSLNESIADVFGQFIEADSQPPAVKYASTTALSGEATSLPRSLAHPHNSVGACFRGPGKPAGQPDNVNDALNDSTEGHCLNGVPNNAWYLATYSGVNDTSGIVVQPSLDWGQSEFLYTSMVTTGQFSPAYQWHDFASSIWALARHLFTPDPFGPSSAVGCAWYAVGVLSKDELDAFGVPVDGNTCGKQAKDAGPTSPDGGCTTGSTIPLGNTDNGMAASQYCPLASAADVGQALGVSGVVGPTVVASMTSINPGTGTIVDAACQYTDPSGNLVATIFYYNQSAVTQGALQFADDTGTSQLSNVGCQVNNPTGPGLLNYEAVCPACPGQGNSATEWVGVRETAWFSIIALGKTPAQEEPLATKILASFPGAP
jgi:Zn-dependent metalloprotease